MADGVRSSAGAGPAGRGPGRGGPAASTGSCARSGLAASAERSGGRPRRRRPLALLEAYAAGVNAAIARLGLGAAAGVPAPAPPPGAVAAGRQPPVPEADGARPLGQLARGAAARPAGPAAAARTSWPTSGRASRRARRSPWRRWPACRSTAWPRPCPTRRRRASAPTSGSPPAAGPRAAGRCSPTTRICGCRCPGHWYLAQLEAPGSRRDRRHAAGAAVRRARPQPRPRLGLHQHRLGHPGPVRRAARSRRPRPLPDAGRQRAVRRRERDRSPSAARPPVRLERPRDPARAGDLRPRARARPVPPGPATCWRWPGPSSQDDATPRSTAGFALGRARDWPRRSWPPPSSIRAPSRTWPSPTADGTIGMISPGLVPIRRAGDGRLPVPGWTGAYDWIGHDPGARRCRARLDPPSGLLVNANNRLVDGGYPYLLTARLGAAAAGERIAAAAGRSRRSRRRPVRRDPARPDLAARRAISCPTCRRRRGRDRAGAMRGGAGRLGRPDERRTGPSRCCSPPGTARWAEAIYARRARRRCSRPTAALRPEFTAPRAEPRPSGATIAARPRSRPAPSGRAWRSRPPSADLAAALRRATGAPGAGARRTRPCSATARSRQSPPCGGWFSLAAAGRRRRHHGQRRPVPGATRDGHRRSAPSTRPATGRSTIWRSPTASRWIAATGQSGHSAVAATTAISPDCGAAGRYLPMSMAPDGVPARAIGTLR